MKTFCVDQFWQILAGDSVNEGIRNLVAAYIVICAGNKQHRCQAQAALFHVYAFLGCKKFLRDAQILWECKLFGFVAGGWIGAVNGDATETSLAERSVNNTRADLNSTQVNETPTKVSHHVWASSLLAILGCLAKM